MSAIESVRAKAEDFRTRIRSRIESLRSGAGAPKASFFSGFSDFSSPELMKGPLMTELRTKGVLGTARTRIEKFRGTTPPPTPAAVGAGAVQPPAAPIKGTIYT